MRQQRHARSGAHAENGGRARRVAVVWLVVASVEHPSIGPRRVTAEGWAQARKRHEAEVKEMAKLYNKSDLPDELPQGTPQPRQRACRSARGLLRGLRCALRRTALHCVRACVRGGVRGGVRLVWSICLPACLLSMYIAQTLVGMGSAVPPPT